MHIKVGRFLVTHPGKLFHLVFPAWLMDRYMKTLLAQFSKTPDIQKTRLSEVLVDLIHFDVLKMTN